MSQLQNFLNAYNAGALGSVATTTPANGSNPPHTTAGSTPVKIPTAPPKPRPISPPKSAKPAFPSSRYTVKPGQTLASLAKQFGISIGTLAHANKYTSGPKKGQTLGTGAGLRTGQVLIIPQH